MRAAGETGERLTFLDNLRLFLVLCVVLEHSSHAYTHMVWWPVSDFSKSEIPAWLSSFSDAFAMPILFYIAGYFAVPSIIKKGLGRFYVGKLRRLGIPWLICILTVCPIVPLVYHYTRNSLSLSMSYWDLWRTVMLNAVKFDVGVICSMNELMMKNLFYQRYMWFLSLLLLFFFIFGIIYKINSSWFIPADKPDAAETTTVWSSLRFIILVGGLTLLFSFATVGAMLSLVPGLSNPEPLFTLGNVIQFRPSRLFFFIVYFIFGVLTFKYKWIERGVFPGYFKTWLVAFCISTIGYFCARQLMLNGPEHLEAIFGALFFFTLNFITISVLGLTVSLSQKYWNRSTALNQNLAAGSYNIYLVHYPFVILLQLILMAVPYLPGLMKFGIVSGLSVVCGYLVSRYIIKPAPKTSAALAISMFIVMVLLIHP